MEAQQIEGGFENPVFDAQTVFRAVMDAMARPGFVRSLPVLAAPPAPLSPNTAAVALALCDHDTPLWLDVPLQSSPAVKSWLGFHTGAPLARTADEAHFAIASSAGELMSLDNFAQGTQEYPDRSATLVLQVESLSSGARLLLDGPGIEKTADLSPLPLPRHFVEQWKQNNQRFPRGIDVIFVAPEGVACLPRTTRIQEA